MRISVDTNNVKLVEKDQIESGEYNVTPCSFEFSEEYAGLIKTAVFTNKDKQAYKMLIQDDECTIPAEVLEKEGAVELGVFGYIEEDRDLELRYSPKPCLFAVSKGSYKEAENSTPPTPTQFEQYEQALEAGLEQVANVDIDASKSGKVTTITITNRNDESKSVEILDGADGQDGKDGDDYVITQADYDEIAGIVRSQITIPTKTSDLDNDSGYINNNVDDLTNYYKKTEIYNKTEVDTKISSVYKYKGSVTTYQDLPSTDLTIGDVYNVEIDGSNYAWNGTTWDKLGGDIDLSSYYNKTETDNLLLTKQNVIDTNHKLASNLVDDSNSTNKFVTQSDKTNWNAKLDSSALTNYVQNTDYATSSKGGVIKSSSDMAIWVDNGVLKASTKSYNDYLNLSNNAFIGKGTLENVITGKNLETTSNKVTSLSSSSTDTQYPSAKCVYDIVGDIETILTTLDVGGGLV